MTEESARFAAWVVGLLPRLALYPGGLLLVFALLGAWVRMRRGAPPALPDGLPALRRLALALAWAAGALLPLPGATPLPSPPDALVLAGLLLAAELLAGAGGPVRGQGLTLRAGALGAVLMSAGRLPLPLTPAPPALVLIPAGLAYLWGLAQDAASPPRAGLGDAAHGLTWLGWAGLGLGVLGAGLDVAPPFGFGLVALLLGSAALLRAIPGLAPAASRFQSIGWLALGVAVVAALGAAP